LPAGQAERLEGGGAGELDGEDAGVLAGFVGCEGLATQDDAGRDLGDGAVDLVAQFGGGWFGGCCCEEALLRLEGLLANMLGWLASWWVLGCVDGWMDGRVWILGGICSCSCVFVSSGQHLCLLVRERDVVR
jgi:hypothetical protein